MHSPAGEEKKYTLALTYKTYSKITAKIVMYQQRAFTFQKPLI